MASIHYVGEGKAPYVELDDADRTRIASAADELREQGLSMTDLAKQLGVNRTYLYTFFNAYRLELMRFATLQSALGIQLLQEEEVDQFLSCLKQLLLP